MRKENSPQRHRCAGEKRFALRALFVALCLGAYVVVFSTAHAITADPKLADPAQETRAVALSRELRCLVCQNQSIEDSNATLARDLRIIVRERISAGDSDAQVKQFIVARYGDWVLLKPPFNARTALLWAGPALLLLAALGGLGLYYRRSRREIAAAAPPPPLSNDEQQRLGQLMKDG